MKATVNISSAQLIPTATAAAVEAAAAAAAARREKNAEICA